VIQIAVPKKISKAEQELYQQLAAASDFNPRDHFRKDSK
jgi:curved DNA-binding protein